MNKTKAEKVRQEEKSLRYKEVHPLQGKSFLKLIIQGSDTMKLPWAEGISEVNKSGVDTILTDLE